jgi:hypothetical protein
MMCRNYYEKNTDMETNDTHPETLAKDKAEERLTSRALFDCGTCPDCGHLQPTGDFTRQPHDKATEPFRVVFFDENGKTIFVDAKTIQMARAAACNIPSAKILNLSNSQAQSSAAFPDETCSKSTMS